MRLHHLRRPGDGTSGSKGYFASARSATLHPSVIEAYRVCLEGHGGLLRGRAERSQPPKPRSGLRPRRKGVDGEDLGRGTIGLP